MKVIFSNPLPFFLAHGGTETLLKSLMRELQVLGVDVEPERWWDENQTGDILHYMNRPQHLNVVLAKQKGMKVVMTENLDATASRSDFELFLQRLVIRVGRRLPTGFAGRLGWSVYPQLDAMVYVVSHEWDTARYLFNAPADRGYVISHGMDRSALTELAKAQTAGDYFVSAATIHVRKNTVLLAKAARRAGVPVIFIGKPYTDDDPYYREFLSLVDDKFVKYEGFVSEARKFELLRGAEGFALLSQMESGCISIYEAAAAGLPLFLSRLPWATRVYSTAKAVKFVKPRSEHTVARELRSFYEQARRMETTTFPLLAWREVAEKYLEIYQSILDR